MANAKNARNARKSAKTETATNNAPENMSNALVTVEQVASEQEHGNGARFAFVMSDDFYEGFNVAKDRQTVSAADMAFVQDRTKCTQAKPFERYFAYAVAQKIGGYGAHQFGPEFGPSNEVFLMPSRKRLEEAGNPYNGDMKDPVNTSNSPKFNTLPYKAAAVVQFGIWEALLRIGKTTAADLFYNEQFIKHCESIVSQQIGKPFAFDKTASLEHNLLASQIMHTLRDLEFCGLCYCENPSSDKGWRYIKKSVFCIQPKVLEASAEMRTQS